MILASVDTLASSNSLINFGDLGKPATILIERVSDAIGGAFKPWQIRRVAEAQAQADKISAVAQIEISELQLRSMKRMLIEEAKKQQNIEEIVASSLSLLENTADPSSIESDWISNFLDKCRLISDEGMQSLWSRILAGEANSPGTFSKRTINFVGSMDKREADMFATLCRFSIAWRLFPLDDELDDTVVLTQSPLVYDMDATVYNEAGITYVELQHLQEIGLIHFPGHHIFDYGLPRMFALDVYGSQYSIVLPRSAQNAFEIGFVGFTQLGRDLARLCPVSPVPGFVAYLLDVWRKNGYKVSAEDISSH